jgi:hypothetical protein
MNAKDKAILGSYARSFLTGAITLYLAGETDPAKLLAAGIAAVLPPLLRWLNPNDKAFGRGSQETTDSGH